MTERDGRTELAVGSWRNRARCRNVPAEEYDSFFPWTSDRDSNSKSIRRVTDLYCSSCPVIDECLSFAVEHGCQGIWGGVYISYPKSVRFLGMPEKPTSRQEVIEVLKSPDGIEDE